MRQAAEEIQSTQGGVKRVQAGQDLWVFGYGSLMWRPDFPFVERARARLDGYHRAFCISSTHHRGSAARPGRIVWRRQKQRRCLRICASAS
jgi:cation transport regulator ChaC